MKKKGMNYPLLEKRILSDFWKSESHPGDAHYQHWTLLEGSENYSFYAILRDTAAIYLLPKKFAHLDYSKFPKVPISYEELFRLYLGKKDGLDQLRDTDETILNYPNFLKFENPKVQGQDGEIYLDSKYLTWLSEDAVFEGSRYNQFVIISDWNPYDYSDEKIIVMVLMPAINFCARLDQEGMRNLMNSKDA